MILPWYVKNNLYETMILDVLICVVRNICLLLSMITMLDCYLVPSGGGAL